MRETKILMPIVLKYKNAGRYDRIAIQQTREKKLEREKYYSTGKDLTISIVEIVANSMEEAEAVMQRFIDKIGEVMKDEVRWDEADWTIEENTLNEEGTEWVVTDEGVPNYSPLEMSDVEADADTLASAGFGTDEDYS
jgi:hypothetical protein